MNSYKIVRIGAGNVSRFYGGAFPVCAKISHVRRRYDSGSESNKFYRRINYSEYFGGKRT